MHRRIRRWSPWIVAALAVAARLVPGPRVIDDAYITFRYAQNLLLGHGLVFNPGELVLGTTTPIYTLLLTGFSLPLGGPAAPFPEIAWLLNSLLDSGSCLLLVALGRKLGSELAGFFAAGLWAVAPMSVTFAIGGMETSLIVLILLGMYWLAYSGRWTLAAAMGALSLLTRPDALLFVAPLLMERIRLWWKERQERPTRRAALREAFIFIFPLALWSLFASLYYGTPVPHSVTAKAVAYLLPPDAALIRLLQHYATPFLGHMTFGTWWIGVGLILYPVLFLLGASNEVRRRPSSWAFFASPFIYLATYAIANPLIFRWYLAPPLPFFFLGILIGGSRISDDLRSRIPILALGSMALALTLVGWELRPDHGPDRPAPEMAFIKLELLYERAGRQLRGELEPDEVVAAADIGALGYYSEAPILDTLGIISPQSLNYYPIEPELYAINYAIPTELVHELRPERLVILEVYGRRTLLIDSEFVKSYSLLDTLPTDIYGSDGMMIFSRVPGR